MIIYTTDTKTLAKRMKEERKKLKISQRELAKMIDCNIQTIGRWERGTECNTSIRVILEILKILSQKEEILIGIENVTQK